MPNIPNLGDLIPNIDPNNGRQVQEAWNRHLAAVSRHARTLQYNNDPGSYTYEENFGIFPPHYTRFAGNYIDGIYWYRPSDFFGAYHYSRHGSGSSQVVLADKLTSTDGSGNAHGDRVLTTFLEFGDSESYKLHAIDATDEEIYEWNVIRTIEPIIVSSSNHRGHPYSILQSSYQLANRIADTNNLFVSSLENQGVEGPADNPYTYPHAGVLHAMDEGNITEALGKTLMAGYTIGDLGFAYADFHGGLIERHLDSVVFVELPRSADVNEGDYVAPLSTSHATPVLAGFAAKVQARNDFWWVEDLKEEVLNQCSKETLRVGDRMRDEDGNFVVDLREIEVNVLRLSTIENY